MALASTLKKNGYEPRRTDTNATCTLSPKNGGGHEITAMELHVRGDVPGIDQDTFEQMVQEADKVCPVSNLLRDGLDIKITTTLYEPN
jgi:osmotically inducible protein OsmC